MLNEGIMANRKVLGWFFVMVITILLFSAVRQFYTAKIELNLVKKIYSKDIVTEAVQVIPKEEKLLNDIWKHVYTKQIACSQIEEIGGNKVNRDGYYPVCKDTKFWKISENDKKHKCLVYSFGVGNDFSFDDGVAAKGCEVHSFDPSMTYNDGWVRDSGVTFHKIGIFSHDTDKGPNGWKMRTLSSIMKMLGHEERILDILKVDIDSNDGGGYEDLVMQDLIKNGLHKCVRQYDVEIHYAGPLAGPNNRYQRCLKIWQQLQFLGSNGYKIFQTTDNVRANPQYTQLKRKQNFVNSGPTMLWEISFVNEHVLEKCII